MFMTRGHVLISMIGLLEHMEQPVAELRARGEWDVARREMFNGEGQRDHDNAGSNVIATLKQLGCPMTEVAFGRLNYRIVNENPTVEECYNSMASIRERFIDEMEAKPIFMASEDRAAFWGRDDHVSQAVKDRFGEVSQELRAAGSALCVTLFTASVFHSMRAAEIGLRTVASELEVSLKGDENMKNLVDLIRSKAGSLADGPKCPDKRQLTQKYSELAIEAGLFKDAWRNHVSHGKATYDESQAREILRATCRLFEKLVAPLSSV